MEKVIKFSGWTPSPNTVTIGMERDNKVFSLKFEGMPEYPNGTAYLHIDCGENGADSIEVVDGAAEIKRNVTQYEGEKEAYVEILAAGDVVWHSDVIMVTVKRLPLLGEKIEQAYPTAFEQVLAQTAACKAAAAKSAADAAATAAGIVTEEAARKDAERKRVAAETARKQAEETREQETADALASVASVENTVQANEQQRVLAERTRAAQEQARQSTEQSRVQAEQRRETAETSRTEAERQRESMETSRQTAETARNAAERGRAEAEQARVSAESQRQQAETARADAEGKRVQAEQGRVTAEQGRVEAETKREEAMAQHAEKIAELASEVAKKAKIDDTTVSCTEAWSSQHIVDMLCPPLEESGNPVVCYPVAGSKLGVTACWEPTQEGSGEPYPAGGGKNLFNPADYEAATKTVNGITFTRLDTGEVTVKGTATGTAIYTLISDFAYTFSISADGGSAVVGENIISVHGLVSGISLTRPRDNAKLYIRVASGTTVNATVRVQLEKGSTATAYAPYANIRPIHGRDSVSITRQEDELSMLLTLPDTIYGGEVGAEGEGQKTWKLLTLDGTEQWFSNTNAYRTSYWLNVDALVASSESSVNWRCSHFIPKVYSYAASGNQNNTIAFTSQRNTLAICYDGTLDELKAYLAAQYAAGTPVQVAYKLATPVPFTVTGGGAIKALSGTNTILTDADALTVKGRADPIRIIQQLQAASAASAQALADVERAVTDI